MTVARWVLLLLASLGASAVLGTEQVDAAPDQLEVRLASALPVERAKAAVALGQSYEQGAPLAHLLAVVALEDSDATVRTVAAEAVETLAVTASERLLAWMTEARRKPYEHLDYREIVGEVTRLGPHVLPMDIAHGYGTTHTDAGRADALATTLLAMRPAPDGFAADVLGLDAMLADVAANGGPLAAAMARDCLVVLACSEVRRAGRGAPSPMPSESVQDGAWLALLEAKRLPWFSESACVVVAAAGRPGPQVVAWLATQDRFEALGVLGESAASVVDQLSDVGGNAELRPWAKRRLGRREDVLPKPPGDVPEQQGLHARACAHLALVDPELVRPALPSLVALLRAEAPDTRRSALLALARTPRLPAPQRGALTDVVAEAKEPGEVELARLALLQGVDPPTGAAALMDALEGTVDAQGERLAALGTFLRESHRTLGGLSSRLQPVQERLEALLGESLLPYEATIAILRAVSAMPGSDSSTLASVEANIRWDEEFDAEYPGFVRADLRLIARVAQQGYVTTRRIAERRARAAALAALAPRAAPDRARLVRWAMDEDAIVRWHARRALNALPPK